MCLSAWLHACLTHAPTGSDGRLRRHPQSPVMKLTVASPSPSPSPSISFLPLLVLLFLSRSFSVPSLCNAQGSLSSDALALLDFINNLTVSSFRSRALLASWNLASSSSVCSTWFGISCSNLSQQQRVSALRLPGKSLHGPIATDTLSRLDALDTLSLRSNKLSGDFPADLANLTSLRRLLLQRNAFAGVLPSDFFQWPLLSVLDLSYNSFSGSMPPSLNSLAHLKTLYVQNNLLSGPIPSLNHIAGLKSFNVSNNNLNGSIPESLRRFPASCFAGNGNLCGPPLADCIIAPMPSHERSRSRTVGFVLIAVGGTILLLTLLILLCISIAKRSKARRRTTRSRSAGNDSTREGIASTGAPIAGQTMREPLAAFQEVKEKNSLVFTDGKQLFDLEDLLQASAEVLGKGTMGSSYKAVLENGQIVAVKRVQEIDEGRRDEYRNGLEGIGRVRHDNVVALRAYYVGMNESLLVYDFMQNGSLSALLHGSRIAGFNPLDWDARLRIALTTARGLEAIHARNIVHGNIKSSNVLLKSNLEGCVTDYGISPLIASAPEPRKAAGYIAPEVTGPRQVTPKSDVFAFGVLLLELLTGKVPVAPSASDARRSASSSAPAGGQLPPAAAAGSPAARGGDDDEPVDLPRWVRSVAHEQWTAEVLDPLLVQLGQTTANEEDMVHLLQGALSCVSPYPDQRPDMSSVVQMINSIHRSSDDDKSDTA